MVFSSMEYLVFFPVVCLVYFLIPRKIRYIWLLVTSYYFYMCWNAKYALLIFASTIVTYASGIGIEWLNKRIVAEKAVIWKKACVVTSLLINFSILVFFKYSSFFFENLSSILSRVGVNFVQPAFDIVLPVGISFYTFQALGYTIDVYRGKTVAEKNFLRYALFVSFFPQLVAGPIERSDNLLKQLKEATVFNVKNARIGLLTMAYGLLVKIVVADNIATLINPIINNYQQYDGMVLLTAVVLFAFQIYCDFEGYTQMAIGSARVLGYQLQENFNTPYLATSVKVFWNRWHISLTQWFTDYLYIPLGGNRKGKFRKCLNILIVFLSSGLWHGAGWNYVLWGGINGIALILQDITKELRSKLYSLLGIDTMRRGWKLFSGLVTFVIIDFTWVFFRAPDFYSALQILGKIVEDFRFSYLFTVAFFQMFGSTYQFVVIVCSLIVVFLLDWLKHKGIDYRECIFRQQIVFRWIIYIFVISIILIWGCYGDGYEQTQFIYFQF